VTSEWRFISDLIRGRGDENFDSVAEVLWRGKMAFLLLPGVRDGWMCCYWEILTLKGVGRARDFERSFLHIS
jgi:hypothetical protein